MGVVADLADRVLVMKDGLTVEQDDVHTIFNNPKHPYTQELLAAVPKLGSVEGRKSVEKTNAILSLKDVTIEYPKRGRVPAFTAAKGISLDIYPGEILGLVGESGSGKTTIGRAAIGLLPIKSGVIEVAGKDLSNPNAKSLRDIRQHTGIVFQDPASSEPSSSYWREHWRAAFAGGCS